MVPADILRHRPNVIPPHCETSTFSLYPISTCVAKASKYATHVLAPAPFFVFAYSLTLSFSGWNLTGKRQYCTKPVWRCISVVMTALWRAAMWMSMATQGSERSWVAQS